jgi:predicted phage tail protein
VEVRYRLADEAGAWTTVTIPSGASSITLDGVIRGETYQIEARNVGVNGAASAWTQQTCVVDSATTKPSAPTSLSVVSGVTGITLSWTSPANQTSDAQYNVYRCGNASGAPDGNWVNIATLAATSYTDSTFVSSANWYRVQAVNYSGLTSGFTAPVLADGTVPELAGVTTQNDKATAYVMSDGTTMARVLVQWTKTTDTLVASGGTIQIRYQFTTSGTAQPSTTLNPTQNADGTWTTAWISAGSTAGSETSFYIDGLSGYNSIAVQLRAVRANGVASAWASPSIPSLVLLRGSATVIASGV